MSLPFPPDNSTLMTATDPVANLQTLIRCPSVTPAEGGALSALDAMLSPLGFKVDKVKATEAGTPDIENLYARLGSDGPHLMFAGTHGRRAGRRRSRLDASPSPRKFQAANSSVVVQST